MTQQFEIFVENKPGDMSRVTEALSRNSVNIRGISTDLGSPRPMIRVITDDDASTRSALRTAKMEFSERYIDVISLPDRPGELAKVAKVLSKAGINIESMYILGTHGNSVDEIAIATDNDARAKEVLSKYL